MMKTLLDGIGKVEVFTDPFPHVVIRDAFDEQLCDRLIDEFPGISTVTQSQQFVSNERYSYPARDVFANLEVSDLWKEFVQLHTSDRFLGHIGRLFEDHIRQYHPKFEQLIGKIPALKAGVRKIDDYSTADVLMDAQICINAPVTETPKPIKLAHIDRPQVLFVGLYYLRRSDDDSTGGNLEIYRFKSGKPYGFKGQFIDDRYVECVKTVNYERNVLVLFLNSIHSLHGVTVRSKTNAPRCFVNLIGEVKQPLFNYRLYEEQKNLISKFRAKLWDLVT
ncbi:hypothetical protein Q2T42_19265 [Leptolyngbya boryana CZ1]|uniref:Prolyl 4-hydroxylase alpha subunit Fe(2+) 2OG dioxygenase domain-containing protein n=1 Tax=Leptolyngbya boryana CZ1 TaxID=3060204 RepID=A0AA97AR84_LEPBY|nr:hypothetical protein [Leptolyngbya boryana]WNZ43975.1 hypothetical protein Q2T42_19265 [Leptolyngbya boryana CZ1]